MSRELLDETKGAYEWTVRKKRPLFGLSEKAWRMCDGFKRAWRAAHPNIVAYWAQLDVAVRRAIASPSKPVKCGRVTVRRDGAWLRIILPSGRSLCYPSPRIDDDNKITYMGVNQYSRKWGRLNTYGGKLFENICQAVARDVMAYNMFEIERAGYDIVLTVHDEVITEAPDTDEYTHEQLAGLLAANDDWAEGMPLAAAGFETYRYRKG
jgi:DNA polymerase